MRNLVDWALTEHNKNLYLGAKPRNQLSEPSPMPENSADPPLRCSFAASGAGTEESQPLGPDLLLPRAPAHARGPRGRFAKGHSGNPRGRPPGIPNPRRRVIDLRARPPAPGVLSKLVERKPWLLRPILAQLLPPARAVDPAERLGISIRLLHDSGISAGVADGLRRCFDRRDQDPGGRAYRTPGPRPATRPPPPRSLAAPAGPDGAGNRSGHAASRPVSTPFPYRVIFRPDRRR
jgi:hypothetical protein